MVPPVGDDDRAAPTRHDFLDGLDVARRQAMKAVDHLGIGHLAAAAHRGGKLGTVGQPAGESRGRHTEELGELGIGGAEPAVVERHGRGARCRRGLRSFRSSRRIDHAGLRCAFFKGFRHSRSSRCLRWASPSSRPKRPSTSLGANFMWSGPCFYDERLVMERKSLQAALPALVETTAISLPQQRIGRPPQHRAAVAGHGRQRAQHAAIDQPGFRSLIQA